MLGRHEIQENMNLFPSGQKYRLNWDGPYTEVKESVGTCCLQ